MDPEPWAVERPKPLYLQTYEQLRAAIIDGRLAPGQRLVESDVARMLRVSRTPVREAFRKLEQDGLVRAADGALEVFTPTPDDVFSLYSCRMAVEGMAASFAAVNAGAQDLSALEEIHVALVAAYDRGDTRACLELNTAFHDRIIVMSRNAWLAKMHDMLRVHILLTRFYNLDQHTRRDLTVPQHAAILAALRRRDPEDARETMERHIALNREAAVRRLHEDEEQDQRTGSDVR